MICDYLEKLIITVSQFGVLENWSFQANERMLLIEVRKLLDDGNVQQSLMNPCRPCS